MGRRRASPRLAMISVSGFLRPSEGPRFTHINVLLPVAGVSDFWSLLRDPQEGVQRSKTGTHDDSILQDSPYFVSCIEPVLIVLTDGYPDEHFFKISITQTFWNNSASETLEAGRFCAVSNETHPSEPQIPKPLGGSETRMVAASSVHTTNSWTPPGIAPRWISAPRSDEGLERGPAVSDGHGMGRACRLMGLQPILGSWTGASQVDTRRCLRRLLQKVTSEDVLCSSLLRV